MSIDLPKGILENLAASERIHKVLKTRSIVNKTEYTILTDRRTLYFNEKFLGDTSSRTSPSRSWWISRRRGAG